MSDEARVQIKTDVDIIIARQEGRSLAAKLGFSNTDQTLIATAISELARNIILYAQSGEISVFQAQKEDKPGIVIIARDDGPGISDVSRAMQDGYSTARGLGLGLPGVRRMMDEFEVVSKISEGTTVTGKKWMR
ncbi:MAG: anti-sigma regulatory factor [Armatimonadetes bacterium]|nr:anti-sigma regulatory factor [Armatimonadota bacterium]